LNLFYNFIQKIFILNICPRINLSDNYEQLVRKCYLEILRREPDESGFNHYVSQLNNGDVSPAQLPEIFKNSIEYKTLIKNKSVTSICANNESTNNECLGLISINDMNNDTSWEEQPTTPDECAIILYLNDILSPNYSLQQEPKLNLLQIGIGNSEMAQTLSKHVAHFDGITIAGKEIIHSEMISKSNNLENYDVHIVNKYDISSMKIKLNTDQKYDIITDNNLKSYACCQKHFLKYFELLVSLLSINGCILTASGGMNWPSIPASKVDLNNPEHRGGTTSKNKNNILTFEEMTQLTNKYGLSIESHKNKFDTIHVLTF
jgi:hypothetical protein